MEKEIEREFYRCLVSDASSRALRRIRDILADDTLSDENCFVPFTFCVVVFLHW